MKLLKLKRDAIRLGVKLNSIAISRDGQMLDIEGQARFYKDGRIEIFDKADPVIIPLLAQNAMINRSAFEQLVEESGRDNNLYVNAYNQIVQFNPQTSRSNLELIAELVQDLLNRGEA